MTKKITGSLAVICFILNVLILPGLGSIIGRRKKEGTWQLVLFIAGIPLAFILIGIPMIIAAWVWALVTSIEIAKNAK